MEDDFTQYIDDSLVYDNQQLAAEDPQIPLILGIQNFEPIYPNADSADSLGFNESCVSPSTLFMPLSQLDQNDSTMDHDFLPLVPTAPEFNTTSNSPPVDIPEISKLIADLLEQNASTQDSLDTGSLYQLLDNYNSPSLQTLNPTQAFQPIPNNLPTFPVAQPNNVFMNNLNSVPANNSFPNNIASTDASQLSTAASHNLLSSASTSLINTPKLENNDKPRKNKVLAPKSAAVAAADQRYIENLHSVSPANYEFEQLDSRKFSAKELRQIRNKLSARNFRVRRKEYISNLEDQVDRYKNENDDLKEQLGKKETEIAELKSELDGVKALLEKLSLSTPKEGFEAMLSSSKSRSSISPPTSPLSDSTSFSSDILGFNPSKNSAKGSPVSSSWYTNDYVVVNSAFVSGSTLTNTTAIDSHLSLPTGSRPIDSILENFYGKHELPSSHTVLALYRTVASVILEKLIWSYFVSAPVIQANSLQMILPNSL